MGFPGPVDPSGCGRMESDSILTMLHQDFLEVLVFVQEEKFLRRVGSFSYHALEHAFLFHYRPFVI